MSMAQLGEEEDIDLDAVADELYGLAPPEFTSQRDARAADARRAGDKALAAEIKKLRRPNTGAWLANLLTRERGQQVAGLLELGAALRAAQAELATDDLRRLSSERHRQVAELEREARDIARRHDQVVSDGALQELAATLEAALADEQAANAFRAGRLTTGLHYSGLGLAGAGQDGTDAFDGQPGGGVTDEPRPQFVSPPVDQPVDDRQAGQSEGRQKPGRPASADNQRHVSHEVQASLAQAEAALSRAERDANDKRHRLDRARGERDRRTRELIDLEHRVQALRESEQKAAEDVRAAEQALEAAERAVLAAEDGVGRAKVGPADG
jgi:hypothetical protein